MGSDLHLSPPTPDEHRIVRSGSVTAVYSRHTDGIYRDGTETWFRQHHIHDPDEAALKALRATHPGWQVTTLPPGSVLSETAPLDYLAEADRDWGAEEKRLVARMEYADRDLVRAQERAQHAHVALELFRREREAAQQ